MSTFAYYCFIVAVGLYLWCLIAITVAAFFCRVIHLSKLADAEFMGVFEA